LRWLFLPLCTMDDAYSRWVSGTLLNMYIWRNILGLTSAIALEQSLSHWSSLGIHWRHALCWYMHFSCFPKAVHWTLMSDCGIHCLIASPLALLFMFVTLVPCCHFAAQPFPFLKKSSSFNSAQGSSIMQDPLPWTLVSLADVMDARQWKTFYSSFSYTLSVCSFYWARFPANRLSFCLRELSW